MRRSVLSQIWRSGPFLYPDKSPQETEYVERIRDGALRMSRLVADLLTFGEIGRIAGGDASLVDLAVPVSQSTRDLTAMLSGAGAEVSWCDLPTVLVLPEQMELLFQNLISNGVRYRGTQAPRIRISARSQGKEYVITVEDNGQGIQPEFLEAIFRPFRRLHTSEISGTGLGLAIAKRIVENHGGRIWVDSTPGVGSAFHFTLPKRHNLEAEEENANS